MGPPPPVKGYGKPGPPPGGKGAKAAAASWKTAAKPLKLDDVNKETLARFRTMACHQALEALDWSRLEDVAVIKGSLEIDEALTGILVAQVQGKLVGLRNICTGRQPAPVREFFALVLARKLGLPNRQLADWRVLHWGEEGSPARVEYTAARIGLRSCIEQQTGLKGLVETADDPNKLAFVAHNPGFTDYQHDLVRVLCAFLPACEPSFTALLEVVPGTRTLQNEMTMRDEISINAALGNTDTTSATYVRRQYGNPLQDMLRAGDVSGQGRILEQLGVLTALDAVCNNWDRVGLQLLWDNRGNLTNICVDSDTSSVVGIDQAVHPIKGEDGLIAYRNRLRELVELVSSDSLIRLRSELAALDSERVQEEVIAGYYREEAEREEKTQDAIMGRAAHHDGLLHACREEQEKEETSVSPTAAMQDLAKQLFDCTGVLFTLVFLSDHFLAGLSMGLRHIARADREVLLNAVSSEVRIAFDNTKNSVVDLEASITNCIEFVDGNLSLCAEISMGS
eukprot:TRINITY_DN59215_c0_g1_i1.p1 TRINITY_DN59215_c0_g1~~TRINITY_DN59215_c0_g1_i1.p1  ORF type:complete len:510 (+),score=75.79 TRINITY_DN59215_c0_g1_i1:98-1627(+)